jgi:predicted transcriptional regulator
MSCYRLALMAEVDQSYLARLEDGRAMNPSRDVLMRLLRALVEFTSEFTRRDADDILKAAGMAPSPDLLWDTASRRPDPASGRGRRRWQ